MNKINVRITVLAAIILITALSRLLPHPYNFSPLVAIALFGGAQFQNKWQAYLIPLAAYLASDIAFAAIGKTGFYGISQFFVYGAMILVTALGTTMTGTKGIKILGYSLTGSAIFWIVSNFGVWVASKVPGAIEYEPGLSLGFAYWRALPFYNTMSTSMFFNAFAGDIFYTVLIFGAFALIKRNNPALQYSGV